jgi:hypothetical protein
LPENQKSGKMKKLVLVTIVILSSLLINSCSTTRQTAADKRLKFSVQGGANIGGITENTDMSVVPNVRVPAEASVDAFTGATRVGYNVGVHTSKKLKNNHVETGLDYMYNYQTFNYIDAGNFYVGVRRLQVSQLMVPLTYNLTLLRRMMPGAAIQLKVGFTGQYNFISTTGTGLSLPAYTVNPWSKGITIGLSASLFHFKNENELGFYFDAYRGSQVYEDYYNQSAFEMPGSSFIKCGLKYQFH